MLSVFKTAFEAFGVCVCCVWRVVVVVVVVAVVVVVVEY